VDPHAGSSSSDLHGGYPGEPLRPLDCLAVLSTNALQAPAYLRNKLHVTPHINGVVNKETEAVPVVRE